ncbi:MAG: hypothetical protein RJA07_432 [Bacteroidota bacterium]|jgi:hypothetical protein
MIKKRVSQYVFFCSITLFIVVVMLSCGNNKMQLIAKKWKIETINIPGQDSMVAKMDSAKKAFVQAELKQMKDSTSFIFTKDGKFIFDLGNTKSEGKFKFSKDEKQIITKADNDKKEESVIVDTLTKDKLVLKQKDYSGNEITMTLVPADKE